MFKPTKGINKAQSPLAREVMEGADGYADVMQNFYIDPTDGVMKVRPGFMLMGASHGELGIAKYVDEDGAEELIFLGATSFRFKLHKLHIIYTGNSADKSEISIYPTPGSVDTHTTIESKINGEVMTSVNAVSTTRVESLLELVDGIEQVSVGDQTANKLTPIIDLEVRGDGSTTIEYYTLERIESLVDLSDNEGAAKFVQYGKNLFILFKGKSILKYDGTSISKAGLPDPDSIEEYMAIQGLDIRIGRQNSTHSVRSLTQNSLNNINVPFTNHDYNIGIKGNPLWDDTRFVPERETLSSYIIERFHNDRFNVLENPKVPQIEYSSYALAYQVNDLISNAVSPTNVNGIGVIRNVKEDFIGFSTFDLHTATFKSQGSEFNSSLFNNDSHTTRQYFIDNHGWVPQSNTRIEVNNLPNNSKYKITGASFTDNIGHILRSQNDPFYNSTPQFNPPNINLIVDNHNFTSKHIGKKVSFRVRCIPRTFRNNTGGTFSRDSIGLVYVEHYEYIVKAELVSITSNSISISKDWEMYEQPGGVGNRPIIINYDDIYTDLFVHGTEFTNVLAPYEADPVIPVIDINSLIGIIFLKGGISLDAYVNIYRTDDIGVEDLIDDNFTESEVIRFDGLGFKLRDYRQNSYNLVTQLPINPFEDTSHFYDWYSANSLGDLYTSTNLVGQSNFDIDSEDADPSSLPKGDTFTHFNNRLQIVQEDGISIVSTDIVYGPEKYNVTGDESIEVQSESGESIISINPLGRSGLAIMSENSTHLLQGDFASGNTRLDQVTVNGFGCIARDSVAVIKDGLAYLSAEGVVFWGFNGLPQMMGHDRANKTLSRIRSLILDKTLDLPKAQAYNDFTKEQYILNIPRLDPAAKGVTLVYDYMRDMWYTYDNFDFNRGAQILEGTTYRANENGEGAARRITRELRTGTTYDIQDPHEAQIKYQYDTDWDSFTAPTIYKKPLKVRLIAYNLFKPFNAVKKAFTVLCTFLNGYRDNKVHSRNTLTLNARKLSDSIKLRGQKILTGKVSISNPNDTELYSGPCIMGVEVETQIAHDTRQKPWSAS